ncbi:MerR family transcriptional regulator [Planococcus beigongshangi]|uniref:MerR family transcriptional regulator n=1 Tax=Planococcus beigongshangi TaxID=2782536 RepID=UPI00193B6A72|nr:MerR family transcriptional regulator [Planococcus beigongshangi]
MANRVRRSMPILPISIVMQLTELTARQIRYYEEHGLISPARTDGNKRMFSLYDVDKLLEIKDYLDQGLNMAGIKKMFEMASRPQNVMSEPKNLSDEDVRRIFREEMIPGKSFTGKNFRQGDLSRFYQ